MSTRSISDPTIKRLFAESKGVCAKCNGELFPERTNIAEICHIEAFSSGGSRFNKILKNDGKENEYDNLIVLCSNCHKLIDEKSNEDEYSVDFLRLLKENHIKNIITKSIEKFEDDKIIKIILDKFDSSIENELVQIKTLLQSISFNNCFILLQDKFKKRNAFVPSLENINYFFFSNSDIEIINKIKDGTALKIPQSYILEGPPSSGKTTIIIKLLNELPNLFQHFYISLNQDYNIDSIRRDLRYIQNFNAIIYIDDCHLNNNLACDIYNCCCNNPNLTIVLLYREIGEVEKLSDNGDNLFKDTVSQVFRIDPFGNQDEKIKALIENRKKIIIERTGIEAKVGNIDVIKKTINRNLLKLSLLLDEWEREPNFILENLNDNELNKFLFKRFLNTKYTKEEIIFLQTYTAVNTFEIAFRILDNTNLESQLLIDALVNKTKINEYEFFHSSFSNLLMLSILSNNSNFDLEYPNGLLQFYETTFKQYFKLLSEKSAQKYPDKIPFTLTKLIANRQFELYKFLVKDSEIKEHIINYFKHVTNLEQYSIFFKQISTSCSNQFEFYYNKLINESKVKQLVNLRFRDINDLRLILIILRKKSYPQFENTIYKLSILERRKILFSSRLNNIINSLNYIFDFDKKLVNFLIENFSVLDWLALMNKNTFSVVIKSLFFLRKIKDSEFIKQIARELDKEKVISNSKFDSIEQLAKSIKELANINKDLAIDFASLISENEIIEKIKSEPIRKVSKCLKELLEFKPVEVYKIVDNFNDNDLIAEFKKNNLSIIGKSLSDFFDINNNRIKKLVVKQEFQNLLLANLNIEDDAGKVAKLIADLKKIEPKSAQSFLSKITFEKIKVLVENASLQKIGEFIYNIFRTEGFSNLGVDIFLSIPSNIIASKAIDTKFGITNYDTPFSQLGNVNRDKAIEILELIDNKFFINQTVGFKPISVTKDYARKISFSFKSLYDLVPKKINQIIFEVFKSISFDKQIDSLSKTDLLHCYANFSIINIQLANNKFKNRVQNLTSEDIKDENLSAFSDGLRLLKSPLSLTKESFIVKSFEPHFLNYYKRFSPTQISITFINLSFIDKKYSFELLAKLDSEFIAKNIFAIKNVAKETGVLGEIRTVNNEFYEKLIGEIKKLKYK
jgi:hypothetical protein